MRQRCKHFAPTISSWCSHTKFTWKRFDGDLNPAIRLSRSLMAHHLFQLGLPTMTMTMIKPIAKTRRQFLRTAGALSVAASATTLPLISRAQVPANVLKIVIGWPPGGLTDTVARVLAEKLGVALKRTVMVENRAGAGGQIGITRFKALPPDGTTVISASRAIDAAPIPNSPAFRPSRRPVCRQFHRVGLDSTCRPAPTRALRRPGTRPCKLSWQAMKSGRGSPTLGWYLARQTRKA